MRTLIVTPELRLCRDSARTLDRQLNQALDVAKGRAWPVEWLDAIRTARMHAQRATIQLNNIITSLDRRVQAAIAKAH